MANILNSKIKNIYYLLDNINGYITNPYHLAPFVI